MFKGSVKGFVTAVAFALAMVGCHETPGSGIGTTETRTMPAFDELEIHGVDAKIDVAPGMQSALLLSGDDNLVPRVRTHVEGRKLIVDMDDLDVDPVRPLLVSIRVPALTKIRAEQSSRVDVTVDAATTLTVDATSSAVVVGHGSIFRLDAELTGSARLDASQLRAVDVRLDASGNANASVCVTGNFDVELDGGADATYACDPRDIDRDVDGDSVLQSR